VRNVFGGVFISCLCGVAISASPPGDCRQRPDRAPVADDRRAPRPRREAIHLGDRHGTHPFSLIVYPDRTTARECSISIGDRGLPVFSQASKDRLRDLDAPGLAGQARPPTGQPPGGRSWAPVESSPAVLHVQLQRFPHSARAFNLSEEEVRRTVVEPWEAGRLIELGERFWAPGECKLTILDGPPLDPGVLGLGRGWAAALKHGRNVTGELIRAPTAADPRRVASGPSFEDFKDEVLALSLRGAPSLEELWRLAIRRYPDRSLSDRLGLTERAVKALLHDELVELRAGGGPADPRVPAGDVERVLCAWETWIAGTDPPVSLRATERGERARRRG
jgi:hypothetical protein